MTKHVAFWVALAVVTFPALLAMGVLVAIMPPLNMMLIPVWAFVAMGAVGSITNGIEDCRRAALAAQRPADPLRNAPGVVPVQRVNAL